MGYYFPDYNYPPNVYVEAQAEAEINLKNEIDKLLETLVIGLTGKNLDLQNSLLFGSTKESCGFEHLANESKAHMQWVVKQIEDDSIQPMLWKINKLKHVMQKFERILEEEEESKERRQWWQKG